MIIEKYVQDQDHTLRYRKEFTKSHCTRKKGESAVARVELLYAIKAK